MITIGTYQTFII